MALINIQDYGLDKPMAPRRLYAVLRISGYEFI